MTEPRVITITITGDNITLDSSKAPEIIRPVKADAKSIVAFLIALAFPIGAAATLMWGISQGRVTVEAVLATGAIVGVSGAVMGVLAKASDLKGWPRTYAETFAVVAGLGGGMAVAVAAIFNLF
ncbi:hypothetical protein ACFXP7_05460 [Microbacterium sp. P06]|uniref:hypothetical protein n=1 Tax=Microbacterium sp. P06 TaxID=3366949 RepID=UPI0037457FD5